MPRPLSFRTVVVERPLEVVTHHVAPTSTTRSSPHVPGVAVQPISLAYSGDISGTGALPKAREADVSDPIKGTEQRDLKIAARIAKREVTLPLPSCGYRVQVRGSRHESARGEIPLTRIAR